MKRNFLIWSGYQPMLEVDEQSTGGHSRERKREHPLSEKISGYEIATLIVRTLMMMNTLLCVLLPDHQITMATTGFNLVSLLLAIGWRFDCSLPPMLQGWCYNSF
mmetsp:Transcript_38462/g.96545  ORF Transcript_38462/g.96545 Transcript_38462/m.96545 type:complete len:105 (-) Transcript_38462:161-475(-)